MGRVFQVVFQSLALSSFLFASTLIKGQRCVFFFFKLLHYFNPSQLFCSLYKPLVSGGSELHLHRLSGALVHQTMRLPA